MHAVFMGEGVSGTGPLRWEGTATFSDGTVLTSIAYADPAPSFVGPEANWSAFGAGMQGELEIFREEVEYKNACGDVVASGYEQGIFNITSSEFNVAGELEICGDVGPLSNKYVEKFFTTGLVWTDDCGAFHAEGCTLFLLSEEPTCPAKCPDEPICPTECTEDPVCPEKCPEEPVCPEEPDCPEKCPDEPVCPISITPVTTVGGWMVNGSFVLTPIKETCDYILEKHEFVWWNDADDPRGDLYNHNTLFMIWTGVPWVDDGFYYATRVIRDGPCPDDTVLGHGYMTGKYNSRTAYMSWSAVDYFTAGYQIIAWNTATSAGGFIIEGWDNDDYACAWPDVTLNCASDVTPFTGWAEPAMIPPVLDPGVIVATTGELELWEGSQVNFYHYWDDPCWVNKTFGKGEIINAFSGVNNLTDGASLMWGTHELTFDCMTLTGAVTGYRWMDETAGDWITIGSWVSIGDGYLVIWDYDERSEQPDSGVIIEL
jgi:hypothetical protein